MPAAAVPAPSESVEAAPDAIEAGLKLAVAPAGTPLAERATLPEKLPLPATETLLVPLPVTAAGAAERLKSGVAALQPETVLPGKQMLRMA